MYDEGSSEYPDVEDIFARYRVIHLAREIMVGLPRYTIQRLCQRHSYLRPICDDPYFWKDHKAHQYLREYYASRRVTLARRWIDESSGEIHPLRYELYRRYDVEDPNVWG